MSIWVKICKYVDLGQKFSKISIFVKIFEKKMILVKIVENLKFGQICLRISILIKFVENSPFRWKS